MKKPPINETLEQAALRSENARHAYRLKEIKRMLFSLKALQPYVEILEQAGVKLHPSEFTMSHDGAMKILHGFFNRQAATKALTALAGQGFKEINVDDYDSYTLHTLKKGRLKVLIDIDKTRATGQAKG